MEKTKECIGEFMKKILIILMGVLLIYSEPVVAKNKTSNEDLLLVLVKTSFILKER
jgi:hypothetical protein